MLFSYNFQAATTSQVSSGSSVAAGSTTLLTTTTSIDEDSTATQVPYPPANDSTCTSDWALVDNVCCPYYCLSNNESSTCTTPCSGGCGSPNASFCMSGTMCKLALSSLGLFRGFYQRFLLHFGIIPASRWF